MRKYVLVCDICSSTKIIENLVSNGQENEYQILVERLLRSINSQNIAKDIYKYLGDGFIIFFDESVKSDEIIKVIQNIATEMEEVIREFIKEFVDQELEKIGMTFGLSYGNIHKFKMSAFNEEFFGRPINLASRLQSSISDANTLLVQNEVYRNIESKEIKAISIETTREFKNINGRLRCYIIPCLKHDIEASKHEKPVLVNSDVIEYNGVKITKLEKQILSLMLENKSARDICIILGITVSTFARTKEKYYKLFNVISGEMLAEKIKKMPNNEFNLITGTNPVTG